MGQCRRLCLAAEADDENSGDGGDEDRRPSGGNRHGHYTGQQPGALHAPLNELSHVSPLSPPRGHAAGTPFLCALGLPSQDNADGMREKINWFTNKARVSGAERHQKKDWATVGKPGDWLGLGQWY